MAGLPNRGQPNIYFEKSVAKYTAIQILVNDIFIIFAVVSINFSIKNILNIKDEAILSLILCQMFLFKRIVIHLSQGCQTRAKTSTAGGPIWLAA